MEFGNGYVWGYSVKGAKSLLTSLAVGLLRSAYILIHELRAVKPARRCSARSLIDHFFKTMLSMRMAVS